MKFSLQTYQSNSSVVNYSSLCDKIEELIAAKAFKK